MTGIFSDPAFTRELGTWLDRAEAEDKTRFQRVFSGLVPEQNAKEGQPVLGKPPLAAQRPTTPAGWNYASTKAVHRQGSEGPMAPRPAYERSPSSRSDGASGRLWEEEQRDRRPNSAPHNRVDRDLQHMRKLRPDSRGSSAGRSSGGGSTSGAGPKMSPHSTTYQLAYNAREDHPELFEQALECLRSDPVPNYTLISEWGDTLKRNVDEEWRKKFMKSMYTSANEQVIKEETNFDATKEKAFFEWMLKQKTYYGDLLQKVPKEELEAMFAEASTEKRREILESLRQVYAVVRPEDYKSHSQSVHRPMAKTEDPQLTALLTEQIKYKTMGRPTPIIRKQDLPRPGQAMAPGFGEAGATSGQARPGSSSAKRMDLIFDATAAEGNRPMSSGGRPWGMAAAGQRASGHEAGPQGPSQSPLDLTRPLTALGQKQARQLNGGLQPSAAATLYGKRDKKKASIETHKSKVPLTWPGYLSQHATTAYKDAFGAPGVDGPRPASASKQYQPIRIKETTCPTGAVNKHTAIAPFREVSPVPECYVQKLPFPLPAGDNTIYRQDFYARSDEDMVRSIQDAAYNNDVTLKASRKSEIPLGKNGFDTMPSSKWKSEHHGNFIGYVTDIKADRERAESLKAALNGPTASTGALTARHMVPKDRRGETS